MVNTQPEVAEEAAGGSTATAKPIARLRHSEVVLHTQKKKKNKKKNITRNSRHKKRRGNWIRNLVEAKDEGVPMQQYYN